MVVLNLKKSFVVLLVALAGFSAMSYPVNAFGATDTGTVKSLCADIQAAAKSSDPSPLKGKYPPKCAGVPSECGNKGGEQNPPPNCFFIEEPIGGKMSYDLYMVECVPPKQAKTSAETSAAEPVTPPASGAGDAKKKEATCIHIYTLWDGHTPKAGEHGPVQAILVYEEGKEFQGPFGLLYNYVHLIYQFMSGIIVGFVVLMIIVAGIMIITAGGEQEKVTTAKKMIIKALVGMAIWFLASLILYTINPTFFAF